MSSKIEKIKKLPQAPGVYFFRDEKGRILYIGKATNLKSRVSSYFRNENVAGRSEWISLMTAKVKEIDFEQADSVLEALILESNLIKKHQPKYNTLEKDDKSFSYFVITKEEFPRVLIVRKTDIQKISNLKSQISNKSKQKNKKNPSDSFGNLPCRQTGWKPALSADRLEIGNSRIYGPYTSKGQMETALKIVRRIFPFHALKQKTEKGCLDFQLGKCPGPYAGAISREDYKKNIRGIQMILEGKKKSLISKLEKEMQALSKKNEFEKAGEVRNKIFALQHIRDVALMTRDFGEQSKVESRKSKAVRVEAYDISNISGEHAVGSMVVFEGGAPNKAEYRKFKIKTVEGSNDVAMMKEVLLRRFKNDWPMPDLILLDGGAGHVNMAESLLHKEMGLDVVIAGVAKGPTRKKLDLRIVNPLHNTKYQIPDTKNEIVSGNKNSVVDDVLQDDLLIKSIMDEAHRFAITFHRKLRSKNVFK